MPNCPHILRTSKNINRWHPNPNLSSNIGNHRRLYPNHSWLSLFLFYLNSFSWALSIWLQFGAHSRLPFGKRFISIRLSLIATVIRFQHVSHLLDILPNFWRRLIIWRRWPSILCIVGRHTNISPFSPALVRITTTCWTGNNGSLVCGLLVRSHWDLRIGRFCLLSLRLFFSKCMIVSAWW